MTRIGRWLATGIAMAMLVALIAQAAIAGNVPLPRILPLPHLPTIVRPIANPSIAPRIPVLPRTTPIPGASASPIAGGASGANTERGIRVTNVKLPPHVPKLSQFLVPLGNGRYGVRRVMLPPHVPSAQARTALSNMRLHPMNASGGTIWLTGDNNNYFENDETLQYGDSVYLGCDNMANVPNGNNYQWVVFPPDGSGGYTTATAYTLGTSVNGGTCGTYVAFNLSTGAGWGGLCANNCYGGGATQMGSDPSYPGIWTIALANGNLSTYYGEINIVVNGSVNFNTYSDLAMSHPAINFTPGSYVVAGASGLNPSHTYAFGWVYTALGASCVYASPNLTSYAGVNGTCFTGNNPTGTPALTGSVSGSWLSTGAKTGAYDVELFDVTSQDYIGHQQISMAPSSGGAWSLTPFNGGTLGTNLNNIFATDGLIDQSVNGIKFSVSGVTANNGDTVYLSVSDPNGAVLMGTVSTAPNNVGIAGPMNANCNDGNGLNYNCTATYATGQPVTFTYYFPHNAGFQQALGPTQTPFAPNVFTAQLYDANTNTVLTSFPFQILGYNATFAWSDGLTADKAAATGTVLGVKITNSGGNQYGVWNEDGLVGIKISEDAGGESVALSSTTATDSSGNTWNISQSGVGTAAVITAVPAVAGTALPVGGTLSFNVKVTVPATSCVTAVCDLPTQILPQHGINYSATGVTNELQVLSSGSASTPPSVRWTVVSETATGAKLADRLAEFNQLTYIAGTDNAPDPTVNGGCGECYNYKLTVNNTSATKITDILFTFPSQVDLQEYPPGGVTASGGVSGTWAWYTNGNPAGDISSGYGPNNIELKCSRAGCGINAGGTGTFTFSIPIFATSFAVQQIPAVANFTGTGFNLGGDGTTSNMIAGETNVASNAIGAASLNRNFMETYFSPSSIGSVAGASTTFVFTNVALTSDPNPDDIDEINLIFPSANDNPSSITAPAGWTVTQDTGNHLHWVIAGCTYTGTKPVNATPCSTNENGYALGPSGTVDIKATFATAPSVCSCAVQWWVMGEGGADTNWGTLPTVPLTISSTSASIAFTNIAGTAVSGGSQPTVGTDATYNVGNSYQFVITNTGSTTLTGATLTIPYQTTSGSPAQDTGGQSWQIYSPGGSACATTSTAGNPCVALSGGSTGTSGTCSGTLSSGQYANPTGSPPTAAGYIKLSGCSIAPGGTATVTFYAIAPYLLNSTFLFPATVTSASGGANAAPTYVGANSVQVVINGGLTIRIPPSIGFVNGGNRVTAASGSGANPSTICTSCQVLAGTPNIIDFGVGITGTFTTTDIVDASVSSDANASNSWALYMSTSTNPLGGTSAAELYTAVDSANSTTAAGYVPVTTSFTAVSTGTGSSGTPIANYSGNARHAPSDSVLNYQVQAAGSSAGHNVTITFTLVFN
jgi:hypothetical protein